MKIQFSQENIVRIIREKIFGLKEKVEPIYEDSDGLQITGAIFDGNSAISWNFWDSKEAMDTAVEKLQSALDSESESNLFDGDTLAYMGPVFAANLFRDFNEGDSPLQKWMTT